MGKTQRLWFRLVLLIIAICYVTADMGECSSSDKKDGICSGGEHDGVGEDLIFLSNSLLADDSVELRREVLQGYR